MKLSKHGAEFIAQFEGFRGYAYNDPVGHATVGFGHLIHYGPVTSADKLKWGTRDRPKLSRAGALTLLLEDAKHYESAVNKNIKVRLTQAQFDALVSFVFNVGTGALAGSTLLKRLNAGNRAAVPTELLKWNKAGAPPRALPGLTSRRIAEGKMFRGAIKPTKKITLPRNWWKHYVWGDTDCHRSLLIKLAKLAKARKTKIFVRSGNRTYAEQKALYANYLQHGHPLAARPGTSNHEGGKAADCQIGGTARNIGDVVPLATLKQYGLHLPVHGESWHVEEV